MLKKVLLRLQRRALIGLRWRALRLGFRAVGESGAGEDGEGESELPRAFGRGSTAHCMPPLSHAECGCICCCDRHCLLASVLPKRYVCDVRGPMRDPVGVE